MKNGILFQLCIALCFALLVSFTAFAQSSNDVKIGNQIWMSKNLDVSTFRNGEAIPEAKNAEDWNNAREKKTPAWCYYHYDENNGKRYGKLYNWYAVIDARGLAPKGYRIPSDEEWTLMIDYLGGREVAGVKLKSQKGWRVSDESNNGDNSSGFGGEPGGYCDFEGNCKLIGEYGYIWNSGSNESKNAIYIALSYNRSDAWRGQTQNKYNGYSVRCVKE